MTKQLLLIVLLTITALFTQAQTSREVETKSFELYEQKKWDELISYYRNEVKSSDIDYYFLRIRVGIAYFEKENYLAAITHFEKAMDYNKTVLVQHYLYYSYRYTNQMRKAKVLYRNMYIRDKKDLPPIKNKALRSVTFEYGKNFSNDFETNKDFSFRRENDLYGESNFVGNTKYWHLGLSHDIIDGLTITHGISQFTIENQIGFYTPEKFYRFPYSIEQTDYYLNAAYTFDNRSTFSMVLHTMNADYILPIMEYREETYYLNTAAVDLGDYLLMASYGKYFGNLYADADISFSSVNKANQQQFDLKLSWFPLGNLSLIPAIKASYYQQQQSNYASKQQELLLTPSLSLSVTNNLWIEGGHTFGKIYQYHENDGFIMYNNPDPITSKTEASIHYQLAGKFTFDFRYRHLKRESRSFRYVDENTIEQNMLKFTSNYIIGGITWTF